MRELEILLSLEIECTICDRLTKLIWRGVQEIAWDSYGNSCFVISMAWCKKVVPWHWRYHSIAIDMILKWIECPMWDKFTKLTWWGDQGPFSVSIPACPGDWLELSHHYDYETNWMPYLIKFTKLIWKGERQIAWVSFGRGCYYCYISLTW